MKFKSPPFILLAAVGIAAFIFSCSRQANVLTPAPSASANPSTPLSTVCGTVQTQTLLAGQYMNAGAVSVSNDATNLYVTYTTTNGWQLVQTHLYAGDCSAVPTNHGGNPTIGLFPNQTNHTPNVTSFTYTLPLAGLDSCYCIAAHASLVQVDASGNVLQSQTGWAQGDPFGGNSWAMIFHYCTQACTSTPACDIHAGDYRTQTQGGWGATPQGNNPAMYLQNNFAAAFPSGVTIGCSSGYSLTFTSSQSVVNFLPEGGTAAALTQSATDPAAINNVFAGQVLTLAINMGMDNSISTFSSSTSSLSALVIASGPFQGWTVAQLLSAANAALGGCSTTYSISDLNAAVTAVNENFDNATANNGYLTCP